jgi:hypothetical protein
LQKLKFAPVLLLSMALALGLPGCSSSSSSTTTTAIVTLSPSTVQTVDEGESLNITATVTNDVNSEGVTWTLSGVGTLSNNTTTSVTYTAPASVPNNTIVTVTATSRADSSAVGSLSITVVSGLTITTTSLVDGNQNSPYFATIGATGGVEPFIWTVSTGTLPAGLALGTSTTDSVTISGTPTTQGSSSFTIRATDVDGNTSSQAYTVSIDPPLLLAVTTTSLPDGTEGESYNQTLAAKNGVKPYTWSFVSGNLPPSLSLNTAGVLSGTPSAAGTFSFTVQVSDSTTPTPQVATQSLSLVVNPATGTNATLKGSYAFLVSGFDSSGVFAAAGSFTADGQGNITSGTVDTNGAAGPETNQTLAASTYSIASTSLGTMTLGFPAGARTFAFVTMANGNATIIEFDGIAQASGVLLKQTTTAFSAAQILGNYVFGFLGEDSQSKRFAMAGIFLADGSANFNNGLLDSDDNGTTANVAFSGTYAVPSGSSNGRGTAALAISGKTLNFSFYIVSATELLAMETDSVTGGNPLLSGSILQQANTAFGSTSLNGTSVFEVTALDTSSSSPVAQAQVGLLNSSPGGSGGGSTILTSDQNSGGTLTTLSSSSGTYTVTQNGRVTLADSGFQNSQPVLYLINTDQAFIVGTDAAVSFGFMLPQTTPIFSAASLSGLYAGGTLPPVELSVSTACARSACIYGEVDAATANGAGTLAVTSDISTSIGQLQNQAATDSYSVGSNGRALVTLNGSTTEILYLVSPTEFFALSAGANPFVEQFQQ